MMSRDLAREVVGKLDLMGNPEFDPVRQGLGPLKEALVLLGVSRSPTQSLPEDRVLDNFADRLQIYPVRGSRVIAIAFTSADPELAAKGSNAVAETYLLFQERAKKDISRSAGVWLSSAIEPLRQKVAEAEAKVETFRAQSGLYIGANNTSLNAQRLSELSTQLSTARAQQADLHARAEVIRGALKTGRIFDVSEVANNELVRRLIENRATLRGQIAQEGRVFLPGHPRMRELNAQLEALDSQITAAAERAARTLDNDAQVAGARVDALFRDLEEQKARVTEANESDVKLRALERDAKSLREQLESFLVKNNEAVARSVDNAVPPDARIISRAIVPDTPTFPKKLPIVVLTTFAALLLSSALVVTAALVSGRAFSPAQAAPLPAQPPMAGPQPASAPLPVAEMSEPEAAMPETTAPARPPEADADFLRVVQRLVAECRAGKPAGDSIVIGVTGPVPGSGTTTAALGLARMLARGARCILVDADRVSPALDRLVTDAGSSGFAAVLRRVVPLARAIRRDVASRLHILPAGEGAENLVFVDHAEPLAEVLVALGASYEYVVIDLGTAKETEECLLGVPDLVLLCARGDEHEPRTVDAYHQLVDRGARDVAVILMPDGTAPANDRERTPHVA